MKVGGVMRSPMDEQTFLDFYKNTMLCGSNNLQLFVCKKLEAEHRITFEEQVSIDDKSDTMFFESKRDYKGIISKTAVSMSFVDFYEELEFKKLYKYSVPFYFELEKGKTIDDILVEKGIVFFDKEKFTTDYVIDKSLKEAKPMALKVDGKYFIKFVLQKAYVKPESYEQIGYRYPIVIVVNPTINVLEIRYDSLRYSFGEQIDRDAYSKIVTVCIDWIKSNITAELFCCKHTDTIKIINDTQNTDVRMYKQMMELSDGGSAELTASEGADYVLPFIGELRELIDENEELFNEADEVKQILLQYLNEKEATASYPYIYVKWVKPVETQSYIVKITFDYFNGKYTLLQHITGKCNDLGMGRMNDAIEYLSNSGSFVKGETI